MYKCIVVDDEELARRLIKRHLSEFENFELVASCGSAIEALKIIMETPIDLIFLDIEMPLIKGTDFLKNLDRKPKVIFTTAYREYALEGFELNVVDYLLKPINFTRFLKAIEKFLEQANTKIELPEPKYIFIQSNKKNIKIELDEVLYIESLKEYMQIHFKDRKVIFKGGLTAFEEKLNSSFLRIHRSYIVNTDKITAFTMRDIEIGRIEIPIGDTYKDNVLKKIVK
jgi:two-component system LytT family response regulator